MKTHADLRELRRRRRDHRSLTAWKPHKPTAPKRSATRQDDDEIYQGFLNTPGGTRNLRQEAFSMVLQSMTSHTDPATPDATRLAATTKATKSPRAGLSSVVHENESRRFYGECYNLSARHRIHFRSPTRAIRKIKSQFAVGNAACVGGRQEDVFISQKKAVALSDHDDEQFLLNWSPKLEEPEVHKPNSEQNLLFEEESSAILAEKPTLNITPGEFVISVKANGQGLHADADGLISCCPLKKDKERKRFVLEPLEVAEGQPELWMISSKVTNEPLTFNSSDKLIRVRGEGDAPTRGYTEVACFEIKLASVVDDSYHIVLRPHPATDLQDEMSRMHGLCSEGSCSGYELHVDGAPGGDELLSVRYQLKDDFSQFLFKKKSSSNENGWLAEGSSVVEVVDSMTDVTSGGDVAVCMTTDEVAVARVEVRNQEGAGTGIFGQVMADGQAITGEHDKVLYQSPTDFLFAVSADRGSDGLALFYVDDMIPGRVEVRTASGRATGVRATVNTDRKTITADDGTSYPSRREFLAAQATPDCSLHYVEGGRQVHADDYLHKDDVELDEESAQSLVARACQLLRDPTRHKDFDLRPLAAFFQESTVNSILYDTLESLMGRDKKVVIVKEEASVELQEEEEVVVPMKKSQLRVDTATAAKGGDGLDIDGVAAYLAKDASPGEIDAFLEKVGVTRALVDELRAERNEADGIGTRSLTELDLESDDESGFGSKDDKTSPPSPLKQALLKRFFELDDSVSGSNSGTAVGGGQGASSFAASVGAAAGRPETREEGEVLVPKSRKRSLQLSKLVGSSMRFMKNGSMANSLEAKEGQLRKQLKIKEDQLAQALKEEAQKGEGVYAQDDANNSSESITNRTKMLQQQSELLQQQLVSVQVQLQETKEVENRRRSSDQSGGRRQSNNGQTSEPNTPVLLEEAKAKVSNRIGGCKQVKFRTPMHWRKFLEGSKKQKGAGKDFTLKKLRRTIFDIFCAKIKSDDWQQNEGVDSSFADFATQYMLFQYGTKKLVQKRLWSLIVSVKKNMKEDKWVLTFARFCGMTGDSNDLQRHMLNTFLWAMATCLPQVVQLEASEYQANAKNGLDVYRCQGDIGVIDVSKAHRCFVELTSMFTYVEDLTFRMQSMKQYNLELKHRSSRKLQVEAYILVDDFLSTLLEAMEANQLGADEYYLTLFYSFDCDGDENLDYDEFALLVNSTSPVPIATHVVRLWYVDTISNHGTMGPDAFLELSHTKMQEYLSRTVMAAAAEAAQSANGSGMGGGAGASAENQNKVDLLLTDGVRQRFEKYDSSGDGFMNTDEVGKLLIDLGEPMSRDELEEVVGIVDKDGNGKLDLMEFMNWWRHQGIKAVFDTCDKDESGKINTTELGMLLEEMGLNEYIARKVRREVADAEAEDQEAFLAKAMVDLDPNNDGEISFDEFVQWFSVYDAKEIFLKHDKDSSGRLSYDELNLVLCDIGLRLRPHELSAAVSLLDEDGSGELDFNEFFPWYQHVARQKQEKARQENLGLIISAPNKSAYGGFGDQSAHAAAAIETELQVQLRKKLMEVAAEYRLDEDELLLKFC